MPGNPVGMMPAGCQYIHSLVLAVLLLPSAPAVPSLGNESACANPVFTLPAQWGAETGGGWFRQWAADGLPMASTGAVRPPEAIGSTCPFYQGAAAVCCNENTISAINASLAAARKVIEVAEGELSNAQAYAQELVDAVAGYTKALCAPLPESKQCTSVASTIREYSATLVDQVTAMAEDQLSCASALMTYAQGFACFACEPNFDDFLEIGNQSRAIRLSKRTCDLVYKACVGLLRDDVTRLLNVVTRFANQLLQDLAGVPGAPTTDPVELPDMCGGTEDSRGDCKAFVCNSMLSGLSSEHWLDWDALPALTVRSSGSVPTLASAVLQLQSAPARVAQSLLRNRTRRNTGASGHNVYVGSGGYDAYGIGCQAQEDCTIAFPVWATMVLALGLVIAVLGTMAYFYRGRTRQYRRI